MSTIWTNVKREPVRWLTGLQVLWIAVCGGLTVFGLWAPSADQLQWVLGVPVVIANALGFTIVREAVTPNAKLPAQIEDAAENDRLVRE